MLDGVDVRQEPSDVVLVKAAAARLRRQAAQVVGVEHDVLLVVELVLHGHVCVGCRVLMVELVDVYPRRGRVLGVEVRGMKKKHLQGTPRKWPRMRCHKERAIGRDLGLEVVAPHHLGQKMGQTCP